MDIGAFRKGKGKQGKSKRGKGKGKGKQGQHPQEKHKDLIECWNCGELGHHANDCWSKKNSNKGGSKEKHKAKIARHAHNLDSSKPADAGPEVEVGGGCGMNCIDADAVEV